MAAGLADKISGDITGSARNFDGFQACTDAQSLLVRSAEMTEPVEAKFIVKRR